MESFFATVVKLLVLMKIPANQLRALSLWVVIVPLATINICYPIAVAFEHVSACIPYLEGCTSVSSTGRNAPESLIFKTGMLSSAIVLALLWHQCADFLRRGGQATWRVNLLRVLGFLAALSLAIYAVTVGLKTDELRFLTRMGVNGFAISNLFIEITFIVLYKPMRIIATQKLFRWLIVFCIAIPLLGVAVEVAKWAGAPKHPSDNTVAWNAFVMVSAYYAVMARILWHHGYSGDRPTSPSISR